MIRLEEVCPDNWRLELKVSETQKNYVSDADAAAGEGIRIPENSRSNALVIYEEDQPVGMALYYDCEELNAFDFSQLFIDERYQGNGYGMAAAKQILERMKQDGRFDKVVLCYIEGNEAAKNMYQKLGFYLTGERDGNEIVMEKVLR